MWFTEVTGKSSGRLVPTIEGQQAFIPANFPPQMDWTPELAVTLSDADRAIGQLGGVGLNPPNPHLLISPFMRREAVLSSRIEGTQADLKDLYLFEEERRAKPEVPDVREVDNYVRALEHGLRRSKELPLSLRLIRELHEILMKDVRGENQLRGQFRRTQNWIGTTEEITFVPPPPAEMNLALDAFEKFIHSRLENLPVLIRIAMIHYQFEAIHPFRDGNGRIGRLLILLLFCIEEILPTPLLYLSAYFERHRKKYYELLMTVSTQDRWMEWIVFFLTGVSEQSRDAFERAAQLMNLQQELHRKMKTKRRSAFHIKLLDSLFVHPVITPKRATKLLQVTPVQHKTTSTSSSRTAS